MQNNEITLKNLIDEKKRIVVPTIQRDYAEGRSTAKVETIREGLLNAMLDTISGRRDKLKLDFIYGYERNGKIELLDGQQRITTLFLMYWFFLPADQQAELKIGEDSILTYEVRKTAEDFCRKLVNHSARNLLEAYNKYKSIEGSTEDRFDDFIMARGWFSWSWRYDPTVRSMLVVINELATIVQKNEGNRFSDVDKCYQNLEHIVFEFLDLGEFNMGEELYVKMNARGKDLSSFDILKSLLEEEMQKQLCSNKLQINWRERMDICWIDYFWQAFRKKQVESAELVQEIEEQYKKFLLILIGYELYLENIMPVEECFDFDKSIFKYEKIANKERNINFERLMDWFDSILFEEGEEWNDVTSLLDFDWDKNNKRSLIELTLENCTNDRLVFCYAVIKFCEKNSAKKIYNDTAIKNNFIGWMRFVRNIWLIENGGSSRINDIEDVGNAITCINEMIDSWRRGDIYSFIKQRTDKERKSFSAVSLREEKIKAELISDPINGVKWKEKIIQAENHGYFWGQIICLLEWARKDFTYDIDLFETYYHKFCEIIPDTGEISDENKYLFYRAMLAASDYSEITFHNTLLTFDKDRDFSLKNYLRNEWPEGIVGERVKDLLDIWSQNYPKQTTFKGFAQKFIDDKKCITDWRSLLLQREDCVPILCNFSKWMRFKQEDNIVYILGKNSKRKKEYFLAYLTGKLKNISYNDENDAKTVSFNVTDECQYQIETNGFQKYTVMKNESIQEKDIPYDKVCEFLCHEELLS